MTNLMKHSRIRILIALGAAFLISGCANVTPISEERKTIQYDGNNQDAGVIGFLQDGSLEVRQSAVDRYNALAEVYGERFKPRAYKNMGIKALMNGNFSMELATAEKWHRMIEFENLDRNIK